MSTAIRTLMQQSCADDVTFSDAQGVITQRDAGLETGALCTLLDA